MRENNSLPIDSIDQTILASLASNARMSGSALSAAAGVAESTVSQRLRRLHDEGYLRGFHADIDVAKLGMSVQALISIKLVKHVREDVDAFRSAAPNWPGVLAFFHTGGGDDYLLHVAAHSAAELRDFVLTYLASHPAVAHSETNLVFEHVTGRGLEQLLS
ncbi:MULTISPECIES: Lrp/AsnC family transcriptional regulator [unclassified Salinibacterium]|uniref:Lrp/AsnC family transcriptional regulator n=1 Tax=unclassified Salinibacterium TaxID=2632331 RepID=UPI0018CED00B|nr:MULTISPECIES: Lrp/AsnC family transcriptional regulator [unclassified Salinibacterium]MBH0053466.1 Lrp/AsnC family transcriptional regulator [Salinibacterium sp. SWN139]MBH0082734.1 Lrp/AsnC family transcriptional regulator [Salinibacterium sp. SWN167]